MTDLLGPICRDGRVLARPDLGYGSDNARSQVVILLLSTATRGLEPKKRTEAPPVPLRTPCLAAGKKGRQKGYCGNF
jgi:hypothetical protein